jgi:hypothetical protein
MDWTVKEVIKVELHPDNMNKKDVSSLNQAQKTLICDLKGDNLTPRN